jgi:ankyrin repeat protein
MYGVFGLEGKPMNIRVSYSGYTPLQISYKEGKIDAMRLLVDNGADIKQLQGVAHPDLFKNMDFEPDEPLPMIV